jgi:hypothetical protein
MKVHRLGGAVAFVLVLGACEVHVSSGPQAAQPQSGQPAQTAQVATNPTPPSTAAPPPQQPQTPHPVSTHFHMRIVNPPPAVNAVSGQLNVAGVRMSLKPNQKCGPRELPGGHWIHIDCAQYAPVSVAHKPTTRKIHMMMRGQLKLDNQPQARGGAAAGGGGAGDKIGDAQLPDAVDHRQDGTEGPAKDQGQVGCCTSFSLSSAMDNAIRRQNKSDTISSLHIWSHYGEPNMANAGDGNVNKPIVTWEQWTYDERVACEITQPDGESCGPYNPSVTQGGAASDQTLQAKIKDSDSKGQWKITEYDEIGADPDSIAGILATGADVWFSMRIGETWNNPNGDRISDWTEGQVEGGHAILFAGYRHANGTREFLVHNSWGGGWGDHGFAYISEGALKQYIKHAYKVVVAPASGAAPTPNDPNALTDDDCGEDQLVDSGTGQCASMCPDDSRPANGQCGGGAGPSQFGQGKPKPPAPPPANPPKPTPPHMQLHH